MICRQYRVFAKDEDEAAMKVREEHKNADLLTIIEVNSPYKSLRWFEYVICWRD